MSAVDVESVSRTMQVLLERAGRAVTYRDPANGAALTLNADVAGAPEGYLPAFVVAGEAVWREAVGQGFELDIARDPAALLGYRLRGIGAGTFATVMLASMEAMHQVMRPEAIIVSDFNRVWGAAIAGLRHDVAPGAANRGLQP